MAFDFERLSRKERVDREHRVATYEQQLRGNPEVPGNYLKNRGITGVVAQQFRLGYINDPLPGDEQQRGRLVIPYLTHSGVTWIKTRNITDSDAPRYLWLTEGPGKRLFNVNDLFKTSPHIVCAEGELDALVMSSLIGVPAVAIPGTQFWDRKLRGVFDDYDRVFCCMDGDSAGQKAAQAVSSDLGWKARLVNFPPGDDVNSLYLREGADAVRQLLGLES